MRNQQEILTGGADAHLETNFKQPDILAADLQPGKIVRLDEGDTNGYGISELLIVDELQEHEDYDGVVGFEVKTVKQFCRPNKKRQLPRIANPNKAVLVPDESGSIIADKGVKVIFTPLHETEPKVAHVNAMVSLRNGADLNKELRRQDREEKRRARIKASIELSHYERRRQIGDMILHSIGLGFEKILPERLYKAGKSIASTLKEAIHQIVTLPDRVLEEDKDDK